MKENLKKYFKVWWIPVIFYLFPFAILIIGSLLERDWIIDGSLIVFFVTILGTFISGIVQVVMEKWYFIIPQIGITVFLFLIVSVVFTFSPPDY